MHSVGDEVNPTGDAEDRSGWSLGLAGSVERLFGAWGTWARATLSLVLLFVLAVLAAWLLGVTIDLGPVTISPR